MTTQTFFLVLADDSYTQMSADTQTLCKDICVNTRVQLNCQQLILYFQIKLPIELQPFISWQTFDMNSVKPADYLWESSCLECFIGKKDSTCYVEINASPKGDFAVYQFDGYRTPNIMPPRPLKHAKIEWLDLDLNHTTAKTTMRRTLSFDITQLPTALDRFDLISPCVILYCDNQPLFFTTQHASPADFHNQAYWQHFIH